MNHQNPAPHMPPMQNYPNRRQQADYHYPTPAIHPHHAQYPQYPHPSQYYGVPPMHQYPPQWYQPYPQYAPPMAYRPYQQNMPHNGPSNSLTQPVMPMSRQPQPTAQSFRSSLPEPSASSTTSQAPAPPSPSATPTSVTTTTSPVVEAKALPQQNLSDQSSLVASMTSPVQASLPSIPTQRMPFYPTLPWLSVPDQAFPPKALRTRRKRRSIDSSSDLVQLPARPTHDSIESAQVQSGPSSSAVPESESKNESVGDGQPAMSIPEMILAPEPVPAPTPLPTLSPSATQSHKRSPTALVVPVLPILPSFGKISPSQPKPQNAEKQSEVSAQASLDSSVVAEVNGTNTNDVEAKPEAPESAQAPAAPKSWAELLRSKSAAANGVVNNPGTTPLVNGVIVPKAESLADVLSVYSVENDEKLSFLEPRGLVNTGNMCYMNSVLQTLVFCVPFYEFLNQVAKRVVHSFKSDMPLVEAMIMFMREYNTIDSALSAEQLRMRLKENDFEKFGDAFIPEFVYDVIKRLSRFSTMRRGHQQDAEEFLGFLLEELHDECVLVMKQSLANGTSTVPDTLSPPTSDASSAVNGNGDSGWLEVGPKQKAAVTRSSGAVITESPITKIFGGKLRSELRVPGLQNSVTLERYQSLQLDIEDTNIHNITDALKGLTRSETLYGDFKSPRGPNTNATKQVFIETLPPVLILHLKRFRYDNTGGTQKIWKKIGNPLELEIPKEVFPPQKRGQYTARPGGLPKYRLISVVYHHGKNAGGGHYTVDMRRQDGRDWIRLDDTVIRRVRSDDVAGEGEEDPKVLAKALEQHRNDQDAGRNIYEAAGLDAADDEDSERGWSQVNGQSTSPSGAAAKKWPNVNGTGTATPSTAGRQTPRDRSSFKDNRVAYILFYERILP